MIMTTFPLPVLADPLKIEEMFQKIENRKQLELMLLDPQVIELTRQFPQTRQAIAAVVRRLQEERERKKRIRKVEGKEELQAIPKWFTCINFLKNFSAPSKQSSRQVMRTSEPTLRRRNKLTRSTPNLELTALPQVPEQQQPTPSMNIQPVNMNTDKMEEMAVCIRNMSKDDLPLNLMEFCTSEKGRAMISSLINSTNLKQFLRIKSILPTESHQLSQCIDLLDCSELRCVEYCVPKKSNSQSFVILRSRASRYSPRLTFDGHRTRLKTVVSSSTQTAYSGSCSQCSSNGLSTDSFSSYCDTVRDKNIKKNCELTLRKQNIVKGSKSQSAMYTTDYSECDCCMSSQDELTSGKYLSRILTHAVVPNIKYLTTPDVLVTYSGRERPSDSDSSSSSCKACKANICSESIQREPREIWTQKRMKTSCESCLNTFRTEYIRKSRFSNEMNKSSNRSGSYGSISSDESSRGIAKDVGQVGEECYVRAKSILNNTQEKDRGDDFDKRMELIMNDVSVYEERIIREEKYGNDTKNNDCLDGKNVPSVEFDDEEPDSNEKQIDSLYESPPQSFPPMIQESHSYMTLENESNGINVNNEGSGQPMRSAHPDTNRYLPNSGNTYKFHSTSSGEDSNYTERIVARTRKQRKRVRNKGGSCSSTSDSSSNSSLPRQNRLYSRRPKPNVESNPNPALLASPQQCLLQKISKQKSKKKNCAIM